MEQKPRTGRAIMCAATLTLLSAIGCSDPPDMRDERLADLAQQSVEQQARQNQEIARQSQAVVEESRQLAEASKELVTKDTEARRELLAAQRDLTSQLNQQRPAIDAGRDDLEQERRQLAEQRHTDPIVAASIQTVGLILACLLPLLVCALIIRQVSRGESDDALPLAGWELVQKSLDREFGNHRQFEQAVHDACKDQSQMAELILHGENYVAMSLYEAARDYYAIQATQ